VDAIMVKVVAAKATTRIRPVTTECFIGLNVTPSPGESTVRFQPMLAGRALEPTLVACASSEDWLQADY
jgi:hypothetical protein